MSAVCLYVLRQTKALEHSAPRRFYSSDESKILVFERGALLFLFNFHSSISVSDYSVVVPPASRGYRLRLDTDETRFGGQGRIQPGQTFEVIDELRGNELCNVIKVYLPSRTAMILERIEDTKE